MPSLIFIGLTGLIFKLLPKMGKNFPFGFLLRSNPDTCSLETLALPTNASSLQIIRADKLLFSFHPIGLDCRFPGQLRQIAQILHSTDLSPPLYYSTICFSMAVTPMTLEDIITNITNIIKMHFKILHTLLKPKVEWVFLYNKYM